ncbi:GHMP kinase [bacterium]|nr:GHMP kinase [candidate division CSSED10-310 bacterium]
MMEIFIPGRLCLFGEHSDWAGGYRESDPSILPGYCLITGTDQGIRADVSENDGWFEVMSVLPGGSRIGPKRIPFAPEQLLKMARSTDFFRYAAGVAYEISTRFNLSGIRINVTSMNLPLKKGLSSSAAICVLTARAFNIIYDLHLTVEQEMEFAYLGELTAGSQCGRMDQMCAYGKIPIFLTFDGNRTAMERLSASRTFYFLVVDLKSTKNTQAILTSLNAAFNHSEPAIRDSVRSGLGKENKRILFHAREAIISGDGETLGALMTEAQTIFDRYLLPACPRELSAPRLRSVLNHPHAKKLAFGGKGVGSQGDGCAQFVMPDPDARDSLSKVLEKELSVTCLPLTLPASQ